MKIAVVGGGISGIAAARVLKHFGHQVTLFERGTEPGGVWAGAYPEVRLQNVAEHYRLSDFPWPFQPDQHPSREQIRAYLSMVTLAAERDTEVHHVFRAPRWLLPKYIFGIHYSHVLFARINTAMIPSWVQPTAAERFLHTRLAPVVNGFWKMIERVVQMQFDAQGRGADDEGLRRLALLRPDKPFVYEMRSATAVAPDSYFKLVAQGQIQPHRGEVAGFYDKGLRLADGRQIPCELVVMSTGSRPPAFPFLPEPYRKLLESEEDGAQLYRHLLHPRIPRLAFAGFNHGFLHVPDVEISMLWLSALLRGDLELPKVEEMERRIEEIRSWKRENVLFEPSRGCAVSTRFHQYADVLLGDLGLNPYRKKNPLAEFLAGYVASDYGGLLDEYERVRGSLRLPRQPLPLST